MRSPISAMADYYKDVIEEAEHRLESIAKNTVVVAVLAKFKDDPGAILSGAEDTAHQAYRRAQKEVASLKMERDTHVRAAQAAVMAAGACGGKRPREELQFFKCHFGEVDGKANKSMLGQRDSLVKVREVLRPEGCGPGLCRGAGGRPPGEGEAD